MGYSLHDPVVSLFLKALWFLGGLYFQCRVFYPTVHSMKMIKNVALDP